MAINFFDPGCVTVTSEKIFGIYDVPPATLVFVNSDGWNVWVDNEAGIEITFTAIDQCLSISRLDGERCEAMITYSDVLTFIELKDRDGGRWAGKSRDQLKNTIRLFIRDVGITGYKRLYGHIANKQRPNFKAGGGSFFQKFEDETGFILRVSDVIKID
jgi:hypothetical protein